MRRPAPAARLYLGTYETQSWCKHDAPGPCIESGKQRCRGLYERVAFWVPGLDNRRVFMTSHIATWIVEQVNPQTIDELYLLYLEFRSSGLQLDHRCENPSCRSPLHVIPCTQSENIMSGKDRAQARRDATGPVENYEPEEIPPF